MPKPTKTPPPPPADEKKTGQAVKIPAEVYEDLQRLQAVYLGKSLGEIAEMLIRRGMEEDRETLIKLRALTKKK